MSENPKRESEPSHETLRAILQEMGNPSNGSKYYALTLTATADGKIQWSAQTGFHGVTDTKPPREMRGPCRVDGRKMLDLWRSIGTPGLAVDTRQHLAVFLHLGGNAIVETGLVKKHFPEILVPKEVLPTGLATTTSMENVERSALKRAPTPQLRMKILQRDQYRCRICGRRPDSNVDIELHVHHFRPWAMGGVTVEDNLITLCHTCHNGLDPHFDMSLANVFPEANRHLIETLNNIGTMERDYIEGVKRYREMVREITTIKHKQQE